MGNINEMGFPDIIKMLGERFRDYRMRLEMTQRDVSDRSGISMATIHKFEAGIATNISMSTMLLLLRSIGMLEGVEKILPSLPPSPYLMNRKDEPKQRIRKKRSKI